MLATVLRVLSGIIAFLFLAQGLRWILQPAVQAESLGMPLLEGVGASTQIGDLAAFFFACGAFTAYALATRSYQWLIPPTALFLGAAVFRTLAALFGHAAFAAEFIVPELVMAAILFGTLRVSTQSSAS